MTSRFKSFLCNERATTKRLKVASVTMSCDRDPDINRAKIAGSVETTRRNWKRAKSYL